MGRIKNRIKYIYRFIKVIFRVNWIKTLYINFRTQRLKDAIKLPIIVYGKLKIYSLRGGIKINSKIEFAMIHIGKDLDHNPVSLNPVKLNISGKLIFNGRSLISGGSTITAWNRGVIELGKNTCIGSGVQIKSVSNIFIGNFTRIISLSVIMDTNVHYVKNIETGVINKNNKPIHVGNNCWVNSGSILTKGTVLADYTITARNSFLNKNYKEIFGNYVTLAGSPAKKIASNTQRIFNYSKEAELNNYFSNSSFEAFKAPEGVFKESDDLGVSLLKFI